MPLFFSFKSGCNNRLAPLFDSSVGSNPQKKKGVSLGLDQKNLTLNSQI
jgi:hypothetical protein